MKKNLLGTRVLIGGCGALLLSIIATFFGTTHTRAGVLFATILKALDIEDVFLISYVACVAGAAVAICALALLLSESQENETSDNADENNNDEN